MTILNKKSRVKKAIQMLATDNQYSMFPEYREHGFLIQVSEISERKINASSSHNAAAILLFSPTAGAGEAISSKPACGK